MVDYSKKPLHPRGAYAAHALTYMQEFASEHSNDPVTISSIDIGHLARKAWNVLSKPAKRTALMLERKSNDKYKDDLENHVAYMKFMGDCLHENQKTGQFEERWKQLKSEVIDLIDEYSALKDNHMKLVLDATEKRSHDTSSDDEEEEDEKDFLSGCSNLRLFFAKKGLDENLHELGSKKATQLEEEWDQLRFREMELLAKRSLLNADQIRSELNAFVDSQQALGKNELMDEAWKELQLQEMEVQARKSVLMGDQINCLLSTMKQKLEKDDEQDLGKDDKQDLEKDDKQDLGVDDNKKLSDLIKSLEGVGFLTRHDADFISDHLYWVDSNTKKEWDLKWQQLHLEEKKMKARRLTLKAEQDAMQVKG